MGAHAELLNLLLIEAKRLLRRHDGSELADRLDAEGVTEELVTIAWRRYRQLGGIGNDVDHHISLALETCFKKRDPALACRYLVDECGTTDMVIILAADGRTAQEALEGPGLVGM